MSICRFSSDDFRSDLYIYQSLNGFEVHVAGNRHVVEPEDWGGNDDFNLEQTLARSAKRQKEIDESPLIPIELPYSGESFSFPTSEETAAFVEELIKIGYIVPSYVIDSILERD